MRRLVWAAALGSAIASGAWAERCRQALALGLDVSGSVDAGEYRLQIDGLAAALNDADVRAALLAMPGAPVRLAVYEWADPDRQRLILPWRTISDAAALDGAIATLRAAERAGTNGVTGLVPALRFGAALLAEQPDCWRRTLDISGDGKSNAGLHPAGFDIGTLVPGITVNGLAIGADDPRSDDRRAMQIAELQAYFRQMVAYGPDAFVETALGFEDFERAMRRKLLRELEGIGLSRLGALPDQ